MRDHGFRWGYTWVKTQLHAAGLVERAERRGAHRRKRERKPCEGMMLHQDGSRAAWLAGQPPLDLIVTMDDATSTIYSAFLVEEEGTASTFRGAAGGVRARRACRSSLYTDRGSHYFSHAEGRRGGRQGPADPGRPGAGAARHRAHPGLFAGGARPLGADVRDAAGPADQGAGEGRHRARSRPPTAWIREVYLPAHNARFARPAAVAESAFVAVADPAALAETLCVQEERVVGRDNTVSFARLKLQLPESPLRHHWVKARRPGARISRRHARRVPRPAAASRATRAEAQEIAEAPTAPSVTACSPPSRSGLASAAAVGRPARRPSLTAPARAVPPSVQVGTKKRSRARTKKPASKRLPGAAAVALTRPRPGRPPLPNRTVLTQPRSGQSDVLPKPDNLKSYRQIRFTANTKSARPLKRSKVR